MIPYELIGKVVVFIFAIIFACAIIILGLYVYSKLFFYLSELMWRGYDEDNYPPEWRLKISAIALCLLYFKFHKIPGAYIEAIDMAENPDDYGVN